VPIEDSEESKLRLAEPVEEESKRASQRKMVAVRASSRGHNRKSGTNIPVSDSRTVDNHVNDGFSNVGMNILGGTPNDGQMQQQFEGQQ
jgi:hypothetical protein